MEADDQDGDGSAWTDEWTANDVQDIQAVKQADSLSDLLSVSSVRPSDCLICLSVCPAQYL